MFADRLRLDHHSIERRQERARHRQGAAPQCDRDRQNSPPQGLHKTRCRVGRWALPIVGRALPFLSNDEIVRQLSIKFIRAAAKTPLPPLVESGSGKLNDGAGNVGAPVDPTTLNLLISCVGGFLLICANGPGWWANSGRRFHASPVIQCVKLAAQARGAAAARTIAAPSMPGDHALQP